jgi:hypothetical protein
MLMRFNDNSVTGVVSVDAGKRLAALTTHTLHAPAARKS